MNAGYGEILVRLRRYRTIVMQQALVEMRQSYSTRGRLGPSQEKKIAISLIINELRQTEKDILKAFLETANRLLDGQSAGAVKSWYYKGRQHLKNLKRLGEFKPPMAVPVIIDDAVLGLIFSSYQENVSQLVTQDSIQQEKQPYIESGSPGKNITFLSNDCGVAQPKRVLTLFDLKPPSYSAGQYSVVCPLCCHLRKGENKKKKSLSIKIRDDGRALYNCHYCQEKGLTEKPVC